MTEEERPQDDRSFDRLSSLPLPLDRERPQRPPLLPRRVWIGALAALGVLLLLIVVIFAARSSTTVVVPDVTGLPLASATARLEQAGLTASVEDRRFSTETADTVLEQAPAAGAEVSDGDSIALVVSAGSEEFPMPDVVGDGLALAMGTLQSRGLVVRTEAVPSDLPSDTVLGSTPSPGQPIRTGDIVSLLVAAANTSGNLLKPYQLSGTVFVIDSAPAPSGATDAGMEVARRLRALLQASGATVVMTRSGSTTDTATSQGRAATAAESSPTASVGLDVASAGAAGRIVSSPSAGQPAVVGESTRLASAITSELATAAPPAVMRKVAADEILQPTNAPWVRIRLGSAVARPDQNSFADPKWADAVARAVYVSLGEQFALASTP